MDLAFLEGTTSSVRRGRLLWVCMGTPVMRERLGSMNLRLSIGWVCRVVDFTSEAEHACSCVSCGGEAFPMNVSSGGGQFSLFDEPDTFEFSFVCDDSSGPSSFSLPFSSTVGESTLRDLVVERCWVENGLDFDLCFLTCKASLCPMERRPSGFPLISMRVLSQTIESIFLSCNELTTYRSWR